MSGLVLPPEFAALDSEKEQLRARLAEISEKQRLLRRAAMEAAGWKRCCRCWPTCVSDDGFCGCCLFNHVTGEQIEHPKSFFAEEHEVPIPHASRRARSGK